jgi:hypothetical protein
VIAEKASQVILLDILKNIQHILKERINWNNYLKGEEIWLHV